MGKKTKKENKGKGKEKTAAKTEKNAAKKAKKDLAAKGEEDVEKLIAEFQKQDRQRDKVIEEKCPPPSPRSNMSLSANPDRDELIMFGGEYFTGNKMHMYNDLFLYNIKKNEWLKVSAPNAPQPRSSHQAVCLSQSGGQLWVFGGEFSSPSQSQFYHYKDLWVCHLKERRWEKIQVEGSQAYYKGHGSDVCLFMLPVTLPVTSYRSSGGPSSRSGHRMVYVSFNKQLLVFGGFHDNIRDYKYYNDVHLFDLENYTWTKIDVTGNGPCPRSACQLAVLPELKRIYIFGGYSKEKVKKDVDKGTTHNDIHCLMPEGKGQEASSSQKWKWQGVKQSGARPSPRCGMTWAVIAANRAIAFGGVHDEEENDEELEGVFYNELYSVELDKGKWYNSVLKGKRDVSDRKKRRKMKVGETDEGADGDGDDNEADDETEGEIEAAEGEENKMDGVDGAVEDPERGIQNLNIDPDSEIAGDKSSVDLEKTTYDDGIFKVTLGAGSSESTEHGPDKRNALEMDVDLFMPCARMNALMVVKNGLLYLYGGIYEAGDKQVTLSDMYSLDIHRLDEWKTIIEPDTTSQVWEESDSSDEEVGGAKAMDCVDSDDSDDDDDSDSDIEMTFEGAEPLTEGEELGNYFTRTEPYWLEQAQQFSDREKLDLKAKHRKQLALDLAQSYFKKVKQSNS